MRGWRSELSHSGTPAADTKLEARNTALKSQAILRIQTIRIAPIRLRTTIAAQKMPFSRQTLTAIAW